MTVDVPDIDQFGSTKDRKIKVWSTPRFLACVDMVAKIDLPLDAAWRLMSHEENAKIFRSIKRTGNRTYRKNNFFEKEYDVDHVTGWSVLWFKGEFKTRLRVTEHRRNGTVHFKLLSSDIMDDFDGEWTLKPCTQQALDKMYGKSSFNPFGGLQSLFGSSKHDKACLIEFKQQVQPKSVPKPLRGLARRIAASSLKTTMEDVDIEARKIHAGKASMPGFERYADKVGPGKAVSPAVACLALSNGNTSLGAIPGTPALLPASRRHQQPDQADGQPSTVHSGGHASQLANRFGAWSLAAWQPMNPMNMAVLI